jgi:hypothetical protein
VITIGDLARVLRAAAAECDAIATEHRADLHSWIDQQHSALGPRRHVSAVRRRVAAGDKGAALVGRKALLSPDSLAEELARVSNRQRKDQPEDGPAELRRTLGLVSGGRS